MNRYPTNDKCKVTLAANTAQGVYISEIPTNEETLIERDFIDTLDSLPDGITIYGMVSDELARKIEDEYGIR